MLEGRMLYDKAFLHNHFGKTYECKHEAEEDKIIAMLLRNYCKWGRRWGEEEEKENDND